MVHAALTILAATSEHAEETSKTPFYVAGGLLALFAVLVSSIGIVKHDFPSKGASRGVMALAAVLVAAAMVTAITTS